MNAAPDARTPGGNPANADDTNNTAIVALEPVDAKRFATARARAALVKNTLIRTSDGFMLARGSHSRHCPSLDEVEALLDRMGAPG